MGGFLPGSVLEHRIACGVPASPECTSGADESGGGRKSEIVMPGNQGYERERAEHAPAPRGRQASLRWFAREVEAPLSRATRYRESFRGDGLRASLTLRSAAVAPKPFRTCVPGADGRAATRAPDRAVDSSFELL